MLPKSFHLSAKISCFLLLFFGTLSVSAANRFSVASGNWSSTSVWSATSGGASGASVPVAGDVVVIEGGFTVNVNVASACTTLTVSSSSTLNFNTTGITLTVSGNVTVNGGTINFNNNTTTLAIGGNFTLNNNSVISGNGTNRGPSVTGSFSVPVSQSVTYQNVNLVVTGSSQIDGTLTLTTGNTATKSFGNFTISSTGTFTNTAQNVPISISGNMVNNGTFSQGTGRVTFTGATSNTVTGTAATTAFGGGITVNKGTSQANILDVQCIITMSNGGLTLSNGTFELSSYSTIVPFTANPNYNANARLWCNGGTMNINTVSFDMSYSGTLQLSAGTINYGLAADDNITPNTGSSLVISGGQLNLSGRLTDLGSNTFTTTISGGIFTAGILGSTTFPPITLSQTGHTFTMTGGTIIIQRTSSASNGYQNLAATASSFTGGTLQIGNSSTPASSSFGIDTTLPIYNLTVNSSNATALIQNQAITVSNNVLISAGTLDPSTNNYGITVGGNWTNNGTFTQRSGTVTLNGSGTQTVGGTTSTTFNNLTLNNSSSAIPSIILGVAITTNNTLTMTQGVVNQAGYQFTLGASGAASTLSRTAGWFYGGTFRRFWPNTTTITAANYGLFPVGAARTSAYRPVTVVSTGNTTATGSYSVTHTDADGAITLPVSVLDNLVTLTRKDNAQFVGSNSGVTGGGTFTVTVTMTNLLSSPATLTDIRLGANNGLFSLTALGTAYVATSGSVTNPVVARSGLSLAQLNNDFRVVTQNTTNTPLDVNTYYWNGTTTNWQTTTNWTPTRTSPATSDILFFETTAASNRNITNVPTETEGKITVTGSTSYSFQSTSTAKTITLGNTSITNALQIDNGSTLTVGDATIAINISLPSGGYGEIGGQLNLTNGNLAAGGATLTLHTNSAPLARTSGQISMNSSSVLNFGSPSKISGSTIVLPNSIFVSSPTISSLVVNRTNGATLGDQQITVNSGLTLTLGDLNTNGAGRIVFSGSASNPSESSSGKIIGYADMSARTVGTGALNFLGFSIGSGTDDIGTVRIVRRTGASGINTFNANQSIASSWDVTTTDPAAGRSLTLSWVSTFDNVTTATNQYQIYRFSSGPGWTAVGSLIVLSATSPSRVTAPASTTILNDTFTATDQTQVLPIQLILFEGVVENDVVKLKWKTASELNNAYFTVLHSSAGKDFEAIGTVKGNGTTSQPHDYSFTDVTPASGINYYRLQQTDFDGHSTFSPVISLEVIYFKQIIYPNPVAQNELATIEVSGLNANSFVNVQVVNIQGATLSQYVLQTDGQGGLKTTLAPNSLPPGVYILRINSKSQRFIVK